MSIESKKLSFTIDLNAPPPQEEEEEDDSKTEPNFSDLIARELTLELANKECVENCTKLEALLIVVEIAAREHEKSEKRKSEDEEERAKAPHAKNEAAVANDRPVRRRRMPNKYSDSIVGQMCYPQRRRKGDRDGDACDNVGSTKRRKKSD